jgi:hypothetical protein
VSGINWDGQPRDGAAPHRLISPYDRKPVRTVTAAEDVPAETDRLPINLQAWCGWVVVEDDGGGDLVIRSGRAGADPTPANTGAAVWIGDGQCSISYDGTAPSTPVRLVGCTSEDAPTLALAALAQAIAKLTAETAVSSPKGTYIDNPVMNGSEITYNPPAGTLYSVVSVNASSAGTINTVKGSGPGSTGIGGAAPNSAVTLYGGKPIKLSGADGSTLDIINYTRT